MIRFDMSEVYPQAHHQLNTRELLTGAPPGYVGYEEGGMLVNAIRKQPYSVVLFDEIEKAHPEVFKTFLQVLDDGKLMEKLGKVGDFTNAIILFTSNVGSEDVVKSFAEGQVPQPTTTDEKDDAVLSGRVYWGASPRSFPLRQSRKLTSLGYSVFRCVNCSGVCA